MHRSSRLSNVFFTFLGAASVGLVVGALALFGAFGTSERVVREVPQPTDSTPVSQPKGTDAESVSQIYAQTSPSVALISAQGSNGSGGTGSGFLIDSKGDVVTNDHVVEGGHSYPSASARTARSAGQARRRRPVDRPRGLKVDPSKVEGGPSRSPRRLIQLAPGDAAIAIGSPFGLQGTVTDRHHLRARPRDRVAQRLHDLRRPADRRRDQPRQLRRPAAQRRRPGDRRQLADRLLLAPVERRRLRRPGRHRQAGRPAAAQGDGKIKRAYLGVSSATSPGDDGARRRGDHRPAARRPPASARRPDHRLRRHARSRSRPISGSGAQHKPGEKVSLTVMRNGDQRTTRP